jgi:hypothetical protein
MHLKAPGSELDFPIEWTLADGETISTSTWVVSPVETGGLAVKVGTPAISSATTSCIVEDGLFRHVYELTNTITTSQGRTDVRTVSVRIGSVETSE